MKTLEDIRALDIDWTRRDWHWITSPFDKLLMAKRKCWHCDKLLSQGNWISIVSTREDGFKFFHRYCYDLMRGEILHAIFYDGSDPFINA